MGHRGLHASRNRGELYYQLTEILTKGFDRPPAGDLDVTVVVLIIIGLLIGYYLGYQRGRRDEG